MELEFPLTLTLLLSSLFIILFKLIHKPHPSSILLDRIPGPARLPVIGNIHLLATKSPVHRVFRDLAAKNGPLMRLQLGGVPFLVVSSVEAAGEIVKTQDVVFANRPFLVASAKLTYDHMSVTGAPYGDYFKRVKKIYVTELLSPARTKAFRPVREEVNSGLARWIASCEGAPVNLSERVYLSLFDITSKAVIGEETEDKVATTTAIKDAFKMMAGFSLADLFPSNKLIPVITGMSFRVERLFRQLDRVLQRIIDTHRERKAAAAAVIDRSSEDLLDVLLKYQQDGAEMHLTTDNIKSILIDIFIAGGDTAAGVVEWAMSEMMRNPTTLKRAQEEVRRVLDDKGYVDEEKFNELKYLKLVIKETMRMYPALPFLVPRQNSERCEINGYEIPARSRVMVNVWALGRDPKYWNEADKFIPERFEGDSVHDFNGINNLEFMPFGAGRRICPGKSFGLATVEFSLATLLYHFDWEMPNAMKSEQLDMTEVFNPTLKRKHSLLLIPTIKRPIVAA